MSEEDSRQLCELIVHTHLGSKILNPVGKILIRQGSLTASQIANKCNQSIESVQNVLAVLLKHGLLFTNFDEFKNATFYRFNHSECKLRLSMARYLTIIARRGNLDNSNQKEIGQEISSHT